MQMGCVGALIRGYKNNAEDNIMTEYWTMEHLHLEDHVPFQVPSLRKDIAIAANEDQEKAFRS